MYIGWEQGAFAFKREQMAIPEVTKTTQKTDLSMPDVKEPLKSELIALIKSRKLDDAVALYEKENGAAEGLDAYRVMLNLAEGETKK